MSTPRAGADAALGAGIDAGAGTGAAMFARYAYPPNKLGYCGPARPQALAGYGVPGAAPGPDAGGAGGAGPGLRDLARQFSGAWPYLQIMAELAGVPDPLDRRIVAAYWIGGGAADELDGHAFGSALLERIAPQAGHYWAHLTPEVLDEAAPHHCFHVFGVYPWSRLLVQGDPEQPLRVLDQCRIRWGTVLRRHGDTATVRSRRLTWDGTRLALSAPREEQVIVAADGVAFLPGLTEGDRVALHWDWACDRLDAGQVERLRAATLRQLDLTNRRLSAGRAPHTGGAGTG